MNLEYFLFREENEERQKFFNTLTKLVYAELKTLKRPNTISYHDGEYSIKVTNTIGADVNIEISEST